MLLKNILWKIIAPQVGSLGCCPQVHKFHKIAWMLVVVVIVVIGVVVVVVHVVVVVVHVVVVVVHVVVVVVKL